MLIYLAFIAAVLTMCAVPLLIIGTIEAWESIQRKIDYHHPEGDEE